MHTPKGQTLATKLMRRAHHTGLWNLVHKSFPRRLTVLAYHRIAEPDVECNRSFVPNISATPASFAVQMDIIKSQFNVISSDQLLAWLRDGTELPPFPALITFDDGYRDVYETAFPILRNRDIPSVVFIATDCINSEVPFWWDMAAFAFQKTSHTVGTLPLLGRQNWNGLESRMQMARQWVDAAKYLSHEEKKQSVAALASTLDVVSTDETFKDMHMTWEQIEHLAANGVAMGAHTRSHPILTRISDEQARSEIEGSKSMLEAHLGRAVPTFAYPNGMSSDFDHGHQKILDDAGFEAAFTLSPGPCGLRETRKAPLAIRRILVTLRDDTARFMAKVTGMARAIHVS